jgi:hypothetical protein
MPFELEFEDTIDGSALDPSHGIRHKEVTLVRNPRFHEWSKAAQPTAIPTGSS